MSRNIKSNDRLFITGKTGSGKTFLAKYLTANLNRLVVLDGKGTLDSWDLELYDEKNKRRLIENKPVRTRVVYNPQYTLQENWNDILETVYLSGNCTIYIDELYTVVPPGKNPNNYLTGIWTRGRELNIGGWASTQRPASIPFIVITESEFFFMFRLLMEEDKIRMSTFMGKSVLEPIKDKYGFYYYDALEDNPIYISKLKTS